MRIGFVVIGLLLSSSVYASSYERVLQRLNRMSEENPTFVSKMSIGRNDQGTEIEGVTIHGSASAENPVHVLVVGSHHGNETLSVDVALETADQAIAAMKNINSTYHQALKNHIFHVVPVLNIGGYSRNSREEYDANGWSRDPNRDYPDPCGGVQKFRLASTSALARYMNDVEFASAVTIHGYIGTFTYPWGTYTNQTHTPDHEIYHQAASKAVAVNGYRVGTHADVIYPTNGAFEDWAYHTHGTWTMLLELRRNANVTRDAESLLAYFSVAPTVPSQFHEHVGQCRSVKDSEIRARP